MAVNYATLPIIRDGLQIYIDIANSKSYDGTAVLQSLVGTTILQKWEECLNVMA